MEIYYAALICSFAFRFRAFSTFYRLVNVVCRFVFVVLFAQGSHVKSAAHLQRRSGGRGGGGGYYSSTYVFHFLAASTARVHSRKERCSR